MLPLLLTALTLAPAAAVAQQPATPAGVPGATVRLPELSQLVRAVRGGDDVEIERVATRFGATRLERVAERGKREERLAALVSTRIAARTLMTITAASFVCCAVPASPTKP